MAVPRRSRDLLLGAVVLLVTLSLVRLGVDHQMLAHAQAARLRHDDAAVPLIERLRVSVKLALWITRLALLAAVIAWTWRARRIVQGYDCDLFRSDPDLVVMGWLLPPMCLMAPYAVVADVWTASHPGRRPDAIIDRLRVPRRIVLWWGLFLLSALVGAMEILDRTHGGFVWSPFDVHLDYAMTSCQIVSAGLLAWTVVRATTFIEQRTTDRSGPSALALGPA